MTCNIRNCRNDEIDAGGGHPNAVVGCPTGYEHTGWKKFERGWGKDSDFIRRCTRTISGSALKCASGQRDKLVCPNKYCKHTTPESISYMIDYCKSGNRIFDNYDCKKWGMRGEEVVDGVIKYSSVAAAFKGVLKDKCSNVTNLKKPQCQEFCRSNPGQCPKIIDFCSIHPTDPLCSCLNSPLNDLTGARAPPASCFDNACMQTGYHSTNMERVSKNCPNVIDCKQIIDVQPGAILSNVKIKQTCKMAIAKDLTEKQSAVTTARQAAANREAERRAKELADAHAAQRTRNNAKYLEDTPAWQQKYDSAVSTGIGKKVANKINSVVPNTGLVLGGVDVDEVKPLLVLLIMIIILVLVSIPDEPGPAYRTPGPAYRTPGPAYY
jgi:pyruvoyl-dependent arginine decarboxylase (PvlArgDC)